MRTLGMEIECTSSNDRPDDDNDAGLAIDSVNAAIHEAKRTGELNSSRQYEAMYGRHTSSTTDDILIDPEEEGIECRLPPITLREFPLARVVLRGLRNGGFTTTRMNGGHMHLGYQVDESICSKAMMMWGATWNIFDSTLRHLVQRYRRDNYNCSRPYRSLQMSQFESVLSALGGMGSYALTDHFYDLCNNAVVGYKREFNTTEVRLHHATLNARPWYYWGVLMDGLLSFAEQAARENNMDAIRQLQRSHNNIPTGDIEMRVRHMVGVASPFVASRRRTSLETQMVARIARYRRSR